MCCALIVLLLQQDHNLILTGVAGVKNSTLHGYRLLQDVVLNIVLWL